MCENRHEEEGNGIKEKSVAEDVSPSWTPPDIKHNPDLGHVGPSKDMKLPPDFLCGSKAGAAQHQLPPSPAFQDNAHVSSRPVLCLRPPQLRQGSPGPTDERHLAKHRERLCLGPTQAGNKSCPRPRRRHPRKRSWSQKSSQGL